MMMVLLYHRVGDGKYSNSLPMIKQNLSWISQHCTTIWPGDPFHLFRRNVCLTFDDATFDFYRFVFPLLRQFHLKALLAVPVHFIQESTNLDPSIRLSAPYSIHMEGETFKTHVPFCTWEEIKEMVQSGYVQVASHSMNHQNLLAKGIDLDQEIGFSKQVLEEKLQVPISTFVYPLGKFNRDIHRAVKLHYTYAMRIGTAVNMSWQNHSGIIYRISSDNLQTPDQHFHWSCKISYFWFYLLNSLRGR